MTELPFAILLWLVVVVGGLAAVALVVFCGLLGLGVVAETWSTVRKRTRRTR